MTRWLISKVDIALVDLKAHHEGWARKATQEVLELERAVEVTFLRISFTHSVHVTTSCSCINLMFT